MATTNVTPLAMWRPISAASNSGSPGGASSRRISIASSSGRAANGGASSHSLPSRSSDRYRSGWSPASGAPAPHVGARASARSRSSLRMSSSRDHTRTGSKTTTGPWNSSSTVRSGTSHGIQDSIPANCKPATNRSHVDAAHDSARRRSWALARASSEGRNSRAGKMSTVSATSELRWLDAENHRAESTVSPQNSNLAGRRPCAGNTSRMPPRTANSPRPSTRSVRW